MERLKGLTARSRMAYAVACLEKLAAKLNYSSPKFKEMLGLLWSYTDTQHLLKWNQAVNSDCWGNYLDYGFWLCCDEPRPAVKSEPFSDAPEAILGTMALCALIGESHLYAAFNSGNSEAYLEKLLTIMGEHRLPLPPMDRFKKNSLEIAGKGEEIGFPAPRSFYMGSE